MLRPLQFVASLAGRWPRLSPPRRPVPVVWYDVVGEPRPTTHLRELAALCAVGGIGGNVRARTEWGGTPDARATAAAGAGWSGVVFSRTA